MVVKKKPKKVKSVERQKIKNNAVLNDSNMNNNQQQVQIIFPSYDHRITALNCNTCC